LRTGFVHAINPVIAQIGPFQIRYYGVIYALGFLIAYYVLVKNREQLGWSRDDVDSYLLQLIAGVVIGARVFHVLFWEPSYYMQRPLEVLMIWKGGLAFHGGLAGALVVSYYFCKKKKTPLLSLADTLVIPAAIALALGRIANFINGELWGTVTNVPWCVEFPGAGGCRHPVQLYAAAKRFAVAGILYFLKKKKRPRGYLFWMFILLMGLGRLIIDFWRADSRFLGLSAGQYFSALMVLVALYALAKSKKR